MRMLMLAALPALLAAAPADPAPSPTLDRMAALCRLPGDQALAALKALPEEIRPATILFCAGYERGQEDLVRMLRGPAKAGRKI